MPPRTKQTNGRFKKTKHDCQSSTISPSQVAEALAFNGISVVGVPYSSLASVASASTINTTTPSVVSDNETKVTVNIVTTTTTTTVDPVVTTTTSPLAQQPPPSQQGVESYVAFTCISSKSSLMIGPTLSAHTGIISGGGSTPINALASFSTALAGAINRKIVGGVINGPMNIQIVKHSIAPEVIANAIRTMKEEQK